MDIGRLFNVLVVGGALVTFGCTGEDDNGKNEDELEVRDEESADASPSVADATSSLPDALEGSEELENCGFCPNECCVTDELGNSAEKPGFECCWGTSC